MIIIPEQISYLREEKERILANLETFKDYLGNKEITSSDYSSRAYIGDTLTDERYHRERKNLYDVQKALEQSEYLRERNFDEVAIGTKFLIQFDGMTEPDEIILTDCIYGLSVNNGFVSIESPLGQEVLGKKPGQSFNYVVKAGAKSFDKREFSGKILEIKKDPKEYVHFITERPKSQRMSKPEKRKLHSLLNNDSEEAKKELDSYHTITPSQQYMLKIEASNLSRKKDHASLSRLAIVKKLLTSKVVTDVEPEIITVGAKFDLSIMSPEQEVTTRTYEMINSAISDELEDDYVERISPLGESIYGLHEHDTFKFRKDNKTYTGIVDKIYPVKTKEDEYYTSKQYIKK